MEEIANILCYISIERLLVSYWRSYKIYFKQLCQKLCYFSNDLVSENKEGKYSIHSMLYLTLLWGVAYADSCSSMKDQNKTFYVISSCLSTTLQFIDNND